MFPRQCNRYCFLKRCHIMNRFQSFTPVIADPCMNLRIVFEVNEIHTLLFVISVHYDV